MTRPQLAVASVLCAALAGVWAVAMFATGETAAALFSAMAACVLTVTYGTTVITHE